MTDANKATPDYVARMKKEYSELKTRLESGEEFIKGDVYSKLDFPRKSLLTSQLYFMRGYLEALGNRIKLEQEVVEE